MARDKPLLLSVETKRDVVIANSKYGVPATLPGCPYMPESVRMHTTVDVFKPFYTYIRKNITDDGYYYFKDYRQLFKDVTGVWVYTDVRLHRYFFMRPLHVLIGLGLIEAEQFYKMGEHYAPAPLLNSLFSNDRLKRVRILRRWGDGKEKD